MFARIQKRYMAKMIFLAILCFLFAVWAVAWFIESISLVVKVRTEEPVDLNSLTAAQIQNGLFVEAEIVAPIDRYVYEKSMFFKLPRHKFLITVGEQNDVVLSLSNSEEIESVLEENMRIFLRAELENNPDLMKDIQPIKVRGVIRPLRTKSEIYLLKYLQISHLTEEEKGRYLKYELVEGKYGDITFFDLWAQLMLILLLLILGINCIVRGVRRNNLNGLKYYCKEQGGLEYVLAKMEQFYEGGVREQGLRFDDDFFLMIVGTKVYFAQTEQILWIYPHITKHRMIFISLGTSYALGIRKANGTEIRVPIKNERAMERILEYISSRVPYVVLGHGKEIEDIYKYNRRTLIRMVKQRRQRHLGVMAQTTKQPFYEKENKYI